MENQIAPIKPVAYKYGLYYGLASILVLVIMYVGNLDKSWILTTISVVVSVLIFVYGIKEYKLSNSNVLSVGKAIKVGLAIAVIGGIITAIYSYVHYGYIYPEFIDMQMETAREQVMEQNPNMSQEQLDQTMEFSSMFMSPGFMSIMSVVGALFFGLIVSLIAGLIMRSDD